jgi:hypothetical protein
MVDLVGYTYIHTLAMLLVVNTACKLLWGKGWCLNADNTPFSPSELGKVLANAILGAGFKEEEKGEWGGRGGGGGYGLGSKMCAKKRWVLV